MKKKAPDRPHVKQAGWKPLSPEHVASERWRAEELEPRHGLPSERDERGNSGGQQAEPRWWWHAIDHPSGPVVADGFGRRQAAVFVQRQAL
jgi:hypothetical protein